MDKQLILTYNIFNNMTFVPNNIAFEDFVLQDFFVLVCSKKSFTFWNSNKEPGFRLLQFKPYKIKFKICIWRFVKISLGFLEIYIF